MRHCIQLLIPAILVAFMARPAAAAEPKKPDGNVDRFVRSAINRTFNDLAAKGDVESAEQRLGRLFDTVILTAGPDQSDLFIEAAYSTRLVHLLKQVPDQRRAPLLQYLRQNDALAKELVFLIDEKFDQPADVFGVLDRLRASRKDSLNRYPTLVAAICVVRDVTKGYDAAPDATVLLDYFIRNENRLYFGLQNVPPELLAYVVDVKVSLAEMNWALNTYAGNQIVGLRFFDVPYDTPAYLQGRPKRVDSVGYNLANLRQYGGICVDQAHFASSVGKSIGVPITTVVAAAGEVGHAWVGFLQANAQKCWWNFDVGRYEEFQHIRGTVIDPQRNVPIPDTYVSLLSQIIGVKTQNRHASIALTIAARRLNELMDQNKRLEPLADPELILPTTQPSRFADVDTQLKFTQAAIGQNLGNLDAWLHVRDLAEQGKLSLDQKRLWADAVCKLCGDQYPDFALTLIEPMVSGVPDVDQQNRMWNTVFAMYTNRPDLAAQVRMSQARMWLAANAPDSAGQCYQDVIDRYANTGPFVIDALLGAEGLLRDLRRQGQIPALYEQAWKRIYRPGAVSGPFARQANWYRVGSMLAERYEQAGMNAQANNVRQTLNSVGGAAPR